MQAKRLLSNPCSATPCEDDGPVTHESIPNKMASAKPRSKISRPRRTAGLKRRRKANAGDSDDEISNGAATTIFEDMISEHELAALFGKSTRTLQRWRRLGIGPPWFRLGETVFYRAEPTRNWFLEQERQPVREP